MIGIIHVLPLITILIPFIADVLWRKCPAHWLQVVELPSGLQYLGEKPSWMHCSLWLTMNADTDSASEENVKVIQGRVSPWYAIRTFKLYQQWTTAITSWVTSSRILTVRNFNLFINVLGICRKKIKSVDQCFPVISVPSWVLLESSTSPHACTWIYRGLQMTPPSLPMALGKSRFYARHLQNFIL